MNVWSVQWPGVPPPPIAPPAKLEARTGRPIGHALRAPRAVSSATRTLRPPSRQSPHRMKAKQSSPVRGRRGAERAAGASAGLGRGAAEPRGAPACVRGGWARAGERERGQSPAPGSGTEVPARRGPLHRPSISRADAEGAGPRAAAAAFGLQQVHGPLRRPPGAEGEFSLLISHLITQDVW